jgi:hypothetical protein
MNFVFQRQPNRTNRKPENQFSSHHFGFCVEQGDHFRLLGEIVFFGMFFENYISSPNFWAKLFTEKSYV